MLKVVTAALAALLLCVTGAYAADEPPLTPEQKAELQRLVTLRDSLHPIHGTIALPEAKAHLQLGSGYYFLSAADAKRVLTEGWGNPPDAADGVLGLVFPEGKTFLDDTWGGVVTYVKSNYVSDADADSADYGKLLDDMRSGEADENAERQKSGFRSIHLVGWAQPPTYDKPRHDLIWAREMQFGDEADHTLNYDVRHLGRHGVLSINMVSTMSQLPTVRGSAQALARTADFDAGARYADFQKGDAKAEYGLAGLVAAGAGLVVAKKIGLIGVILLFAKKGLAVILAFGAAAVAWFRRTFGGKDKALDIGGPVVAPADDPKPPENAST